MINYQKLIINIGIQKILFLFSLAYCSLATAANIPSNHNNAIISSEQNLSQVKPSLHARAISQSQINQMINELQKLINRVESTLITVEAKNNSSNLRMSDAVTKILENNQRASFVSTSRSTNNYSNSRTYRAIVNAKQLLNEFPLLARRSNNGSRSFFDLALTMVPLSNHMALISGWARCLSTG